MSWVDEEERTGWGSAFIKKQEGSGGIGQIERVLGEIDGIRVRGVRNLWGKLVNLEHLETPQNL